MTKISRAYGSFTFETHVHVCVIKINSAYRSFFVNPNKANETEKKLTSILRVAEKIFTLESQ